MNYKFLLESILEYLDEGVLVVDKNANVTVYNEPATNIAGIEPYKAIGKNVLDIFPNITPETSNFYYVLRTGNPIIDYVQTYLNYKGQKVTTVTSTIPLFENGKILGALEIYRGIEHVKKLTEKITSLEKELYYKNNPKSSYKGNGTIYTLNDIIGKSKAIEDLKTKAEKIADSSSPVLIYGETGTGKELFVQGIHNASPNRRNKPFIAQNCAAIPRTLLEGILFGTSTGSFTGAKEKPGLFELANGGTLFLDEINSMDIDLQAKLLRVIQDGVIRRIGKTETVTVDVKVIAATNENPLVAVKNNKLREDLYYRLNVISLFIPPLRERKQDIPLLINHFINFYNEKLKKNVKGISDECLSFLENNKWPGNIRQLKYTIEGIMNFIDKDEIDIKDLPSNILNDYLLINNPNENTTESYNLPPLKDAMKKFEKELIIKAIKKANGNYALAARLLKTPRQTLHNKIKKYGITIKYTIK